MSGRSEIRRGDSASAGAGDDETPAPPDRARADSTLARAAVVAWRIILVVVCAILLGWLFRKLQAMLVPLLIGLLLAAIVRPAVSWLDRRRVPRLLAVLLPMLALTLLIVGAGALVVISLDSESAVLERSAQVAVDKAHAAVGWLQAHNGSGILESAKQGLAERGDQLTAVAATIAMSVVSGVVIFLMSVVFCFFFLLDLDYLRGAVRRRVRPESYMRISTIAQRSWKKLELYLRGISITATANALMFGLALWIIGVPLVFPNMVITFLGSYVPYLGPITATAVASLLALGSGGWTDVLLVIGAGAMVQAIEGNVLHPFVVGRSVSMSPFFTVLAVTAGGALAGLIGALVAVPVVVVATLLFDAFRTGSDRAVVAP